MGFNMGTKNLAMLSEAVCEADEIGLNGVQPSTCCLYTLQSPYIVPGLVPTNFIDVSVSSEILLQSIKFLKMVSILFSWLSAKF